MRFSVILNTFNRAHFLPFVLTAWTRVRGHEFTMIVADDGSEDGTTELLRAWGSRIDYPLMHVRHENRGHRRAEIINKAAHWAPDEALLLTDADSLPAADLLDVHARHFAADTMLAGGYLRLSADYTGGLAVSDVAAGAFESQLTAEVRRRLHWTHLKHCCYIWLRKRGRPHVMGLNWVVPRVGFVAVNGYDNEFRGWGRADGDLRERLKRAGVRARSDWSQAVVFHLHHPEDPSKQRRQNVGYAERAQIPVAAHNGFAEVAAAARREVVYRNRA